MGEVSFTVAAEPCAWSRARISRKRGKPVFFNSARLTTYQELIHLAAKNAMAGAKPIEGALSLTVTFSMPMPRSWSKKRRDAALGDMHAQKPDADNLIKAICDAANGVLWIDDAQVAAIDAQKIWAEAGGIAVIVATVT